MSKSNLTQKQKGLIGLGAMAVLAVVSVLCSDPIYKALSKMGRPTNNEVIYTAGTYTATSEGFGGAVTASVTVTETSIEEIKLEGSGETEGIGSKVLTSFPAAMLNGQTAEVDSVAGATITSDAAKKAVNMALAEARGEALAEETAAETISESSAAAAESQSEASETKTANLNLTPGTYTASAGGYGGDVTVTMTVNESAIETVEIEGDDETPEIGGNAFSKLEKKMLEQQTSDIDAVSGATITSDGVIKAAADCLSQAQGGSGALALKDGAYEYQDGDFDSMGFKNKVTLKVKDGTITECSWDGQDKDGSWKSQLSMDGKYIMTETGAKWHEQAIAVADYVIKNQSTNGLADENGYTDAVASVSINIAGFVSGVEDCLKQAVK